ncbi:hypothetical protein KUTeg_012658 [Tegillarca granosa]|uniref:EF-hand domain-containing protein n=1 Tax=Tegillarca granosa TaxID=220873 RepID=A0ABQ9F073_TEGGR|nr:hypothetical protein KUTeg_012658 [Tegillarca granosa]
MITFSISLDLREVFDLFDFWDGRDGLIDAVKVGDLLRCCGLNPTQKVVLKYGGTKKEGEKQLKFEEFLAISKSVVGEIEAEPFKDFMEAFRSFDREGMGYISLGEVRHMLTVIGERLTDGELDEIIEQTDIQSDLDGNIKYEDFIKKVMKGPPLKK